ncbi:uncharacterized protein LOC115720525 [Cannabis sativa]|uniref:uncharacterized protein LOC115720525 n=1 Tax=Cannabis sativa TaxID=3483 RepID=UPI0029CAA97A|nr:uncharacterized protein LOC115720525 [Cannabis sativa]
MELMTLVLYYNGKIVDKCIYTDYEVTGILLPKSFSYNDLQTKICSELDLNNKTLISMEILFQIRPTIPPMKIKDDSGCRFYEQIRKKNDDEAAYPLLINFSVSSDPNQSLSDQKLSCIPHSTQIDSNAEPYVQETEELPTTAQLAQTIAEYITDQVEKATNTSWENTSNIITDPRVESIQIGQLYKDKDTMKLAISLYAIKMNQQYKVKRSSSKDYSLICVDSNCKWIINPKRNYKPNDIVEDIAEDYSISISYHKAWRAKEKATFDVKGSPYDSYNEIPGFLYMIQKCNPGTITDLVQDDEGRFKYCFFALASSIKGWNHCTPIIVVDATFLKNAYGGTLIVANAQDADRHVFPLAFAIVDSENDASWQYFMDKLKQTYGEREEQCIISDRHESIAKSVKIIFPNLMHGVCCFHLFQNIKSRFRKGGDELRDAFYQAKKSI